MKSVSKFIIGLTISAAVISCGKGTELEKNDKQAKDGDSITASTSSAPEVKDKKDWTFEQKPDDTKQEPLTTGLIPPNAETMNSAREVMTPLNLAAIPLPASFDWRPYGLSAIRDQSDCGSCWAFVATSTTQDVIGLFMHDTPELSPQYALDCSQGGGSCNGGFYTDALKKFTTDGVVFESDYPYKKAQGTCNAALPKHDKIGAVGCPDPATCDKRDSNGNRVFVYDNIDAVKSAIYQYGPVVTAINATATFQSYSTGVYNACDGAQTGINHAVSLVGWDDAGQYWIARNSWGTIWGEKGFIRIKYSCNGIGTWTYSVLVAKTKTPQLPTPPPPPPVPAPVKSSMGLNEIMNAGGQLSATGKGTNCSFTATMQSDGNFVSKRGTAVRWQTKTSGNVGAYLTLQSNGNLVLYKADKKTVAWHAAIGGKGGTKVVLMGDGRLMVTKAAGTVVWANTAAVAGCKP